MEVAYSNVFYMQLIIYDSFLKEMCEHLSPMMMGVIMSVPAPKRKKRPETGGIASAENFANDRERILQIILGSIPNQRNARRVDR